MSYLIAVATSDGSKVDLHFGQADTYKIYQVDGLTYSLLQTREYILKESDQNESSGGCCARADAKVQLLKDCRCIAASRIGPRVQKEFSRLGISIFDDLECSVDEALKKIAEYFYKMDNHIAQNK